MNFFNKIINEKGITLIVLVIIVLISVAIFALIMKGIFDAQSIGATDEKEDLGYLIRKVCRI